jgi:hypothetical protein
LASALKRLKSIALNFRVWRAAFSVLFQPTAQSPVDLPFVLQLARDVRVFDGENVIEHRSVLIEDGKIFQIGGPTLEVPNADVIDGQGRTLLPGLIDAHVHIPDHAEEASRQSLGLGVTTQLDMFTNGDKLKKIKSLESEDRADLEDMRTEGTGATAPGGHPTQMGGPPIPTITEPGQAQDFVDARIAEGSDYIKIIHDDGSTFASTFGTKVLPTVNNATMGALVEAKLDVSPNEVRLEVRDYGQGFPPGLLEQFRSDAGAGVGLRSMRERVSEVDGRFEIESDSSGSLVRVIVPLPQ